MDATENPPPPTWIDLTGLPDEFVRSIQGQVSEARGRFNVPAPNGSATPVPPAAEDPEREAEWIMKEYEEGRVTPREPTLVSETNLSYEEFRKVLDEMAALGMGDAPPLPADWSPHDLYEDD